MAFADIPWDIIAIQTVNGIVTGMILALVASGLTLIFGIMDVVNFAHGELFMLGAYIGVIVLTATGSFWLALVARHADRGADRRGAAGDDACGRCSAAIRSNTILATFGISLVLQNYALWQFGPVARKIQEPITGQFTLFYLEYPWYRLVIAVLSAAIIGGLYLFLKYGRYGIWIRATTQDRVMAQAMGIPVPWVHTGVFAIGAGMAAASGVLFGPLVGVNHAMGLDWVLKAFIVVVVGGMGNLGGSIAACHPGQPAGGLRVILWLHLCGRAAARRRWHRRSLHRADRHPAVPAHRPLRPDTQMSTSRKRHASLLDGLRRHHRPADRGAAGAAGVLAPVPDGDPDLGTARHVLRHPDRLHRHGVVRALGLLRSRHVRRGGGAADGQAAQPLAGDTLRACRLAAAAACSWPISPPGCATSISPSAP